MDLSVRGDSVSTCIHTDVWATLTCSLVHHVNLKREVLVVDTVLARGVEVELLKGEFLAGEVGSTLSNDFDGRTLHRGQHVLVRLPGWH